MTYGAGCDREARHERGRGTAVDTESVSKEFTEIKDGGRRAVAKGRKAVERLFGKGPESAPRASSSGK